MNIFKIILPILCILLSGSLSAKEVKSTIVDSTIDFVSCGEHILVDSITHANDSVYFYISFDLSEVEIKSCGSIDFIPVWSFDTSKLILPLITLRGRRADKLFRRDSILSRSSVDTTPSLYTHTCIYHWGENSREVNYIHSVAYKSWMDSARVDVLKRHYACGRENFTLGTLHFPVKLTPLPIIYVDTTNSLVEIELVHFADSLAALNSFMHPMSRYALDKAAGLHKSDAGSLFIHFPHKQVVVDPTYLNNQFSLDTLCATINALLANQEVACIKLTLAGFASPEGSLALNTRLAQTRVETLREYLLKHTAIQHLDIELYNGGENWEGLRKQIESSSSFPSKAEVLDIIDQVSIIGGREKKLMDLDGGKVYRYMLKHLFPSLRQAGYIRLYYENNQ